MLIYSCASYNTQPKWIENSISNQDYWIGIGIVSKPYAGNIREAARNEATKEIASQIRIDISSTMERVVKETSQDFEDYYFQDYTESIVKSRIENNLPHVEFSGFYEDKNRYYALAKLSKKKYYDELMKEKENAINLAVQLIEKSDQSFSINSILVLQKALKEIIQYSDEPIIVNYPKNSSSPKNLYSLIKTKIIDKIDNITISTDRDRIDIRAGWINIDNKIIITCFNKQTGEKLSNIPILISTKDFDIVDQIETNDNGFSEYIVSPNYNNTDYTYTLAFKLDTKKLGLEEIFSDFNKTQMIVNQKPLKIHIESIEKNLGIALELPLAKPLIKEYLSKNIFVEFSPKKSADLIVRLSINTNKKGDIPNKHDIYQTFGSGTLSIYDPNENIELFSTSSENIYGSAFHSNYESGINAIEKIIDNLINNKTEDMMKILTGSKK